jgi:hypothetical protein
MAIVKLDALVQVSDTEVSTISDLAAQGRIMWERVDNWSSRRSATGVRTAYFANLKDSSDRAGWEISKLAYLSRMGQPVHVNALNCRCEWCKR